MEIKKFGFNDFENENNSFSVENPTEEETKFSLDELLDEIEFNIETGCFVGDGIIDGAKELLTKIVHEMPRDSWSMNARFYWLALMVDFEACDDGELGKYCDEVILNNTNYKKAKLSAQKSQNADIIARIEKLESSVHALREKIILTQKEEELRHKAKEEQIRKEEEETERRYQEKIKQDFKIIDGELKRYKGCDIDVVIPNCVVRIGSRAFQTEEHMYDYDRRKNMKTVAIPEGVTSIGELAFCGCNNLTEVTMPNSILDIGEMAFYKCSNLTHITIPKGVTTIGKSAFSGCTELSSIVIPDSVTSIGGYAFYGCRNLRTVTIPHDLDLDESAFSNTCEIIRH